MTTKRTLKQLAADLNDNAKNYSTGRINYETHSERNFAIWQQIQLNQPNIIGSRTHKRTMTIHRYLQQGY